MHLKGPKNDLSSTTLPLLHSGPVITKLVRYHFTAIFVPSPHWNFSGVSDRKACFTNGNRIWLPCILRSEDSCVD